MGLTATQVKNAKPKDKLYRIADQGGLCLEVKKTGKKFWRYRYRFEGKATMLGLGSYPTMSLAEAREAHMQASKILKSGLNPKQARKAEAQVQSNTFEQIAREWLAERRQEWAEKNYVTNEGRFVNHVFPYIGDMPITKVSHKDVLKLLQRMVDKGILKSAHRVSSMISQVFRYAIFQDRADNDPVLLLRGALPPAGKKEHRPYLKTPEEIGQLVRRIERYSGSYTVKQAIKFALYTFTRSIEVRGMKWDEIDFERRQWRVPPERMKNRKPHMVPLTDQSIKLLTEMKEQNNPSPFVFPGLYQNSKTGMLAEATFNKALRAMGYDTKKDICQHGFRGTCTTLLYEMGYREDIVERQMSHTQENRIRASYDHAQFIEERTRMMKQLADYLDSLRDGGKVVPFRKRA